MATDVMKGREALLAALTLNRGELDPERLRAVLARLVPSTPPRP
jgi:hypothetical protein